MTGPPWDDLSDVAVRAWQASSAAAGVLCVLVVNVDELQRLNGEHGHHVGDLVLVAIRTSLAQGGVVRTGPSGTLLAALHAPPDADDRTVLGAARAAVRAAATAASGVCGTVDGEPVVPVTLRALVHPAADAPAAWRWWKTRVPALYPAQSSRVGGFVVRGRTVTRGWWALSLVPPGEIALVDPDVLTADPADTP